MARNTKVKRTLEEKQRLAPLISRLKSRGIKLADKAELGVPATLGLVSLGAGLLIAVSGLLLWLSPEIARSIPLCRGQPIQNIPAGVAMVIGGLVVLVISLRQPHTLHLTDRGLILGYKSGRESQIGWQEVESFLPWMAGLHLLVLKSGRIIPVRPFNYAALTNFQMLVDFRQWLGSKLTPETPSMSQAFERFKLDIIGPGVSAPIDQQLRELHKQRIILVNSYAALVALAFVLIAWVNNGVFLLAAVPIAMGIFTSFVLRNKASPVDHISVQKTGLLIESRHAEAIRVDYTDTKHWGVFERQLLISFLDKRESVTIDLQGRPIQMLIEAARIASQFVPLGTLAVDNTRAVA